MEYERLEMARAMRTMGAMDTSFTHGSRSPTNRDATGARMSSGTPCIASAPYTVAHRRSAIGNTNQENLGRTWRPMYAMTPGKKHETNCTTVTFTPSRDKTTTAPAETAQA